MAFFGSLGGILRISYYQSRQAKVHVDWTLMHRPPWNVGKTRGMATGTVGRVSSVMCDRVAITLPKGKLNS